MHIHTILYVMLYSAQTHTWIIYAFTGSYNDSLKSRASEFALFGPRGE